MSIGKALEALDVLKNHPEIESSRFLSSYIGEAIEALESNVVSDKVIAALKRIHNANVALSEITTCNGKRVTFYESSPTLDVETYKRWLELNAAQIEALSILNNISE